MSLVLLTRPAKINIFSVEFYKNIFKSIVSKKRGPEAVLSSLFIGLNELGEGFRHNPEIKEISKDDILIANSSINALRWAIGKKKNGSIKKLIAGPNLVISPRDENSILCDPFIDLVLVPCEWVKDFYISEAPELKEKLAVWPAGVSVPDVSTDNSDGILVYAKNYHPEIIESIEKILNNKKISFKILTYGEFKQLDYFKLLEKSQAMIYVSDSESQGIALFEAWARNVPTLVWNRGYFENRGLYWENNKISAPYLTDEAGYFFKDEKDFGSVLENFLAHIEEFEPRKYVISNFTNKKIASNFLNLIGI